MPLCCSTWSRCSSAPNIERCMTVLPVRSLSSARPAARSDAEAGGLNAVRCGRVRGITEDFLEAASWAIQVDPARVPKPKTISVTLDVIQSRTVAGVYELTRRSGGVDQEHLARVRSKGH